MPITDKEFIKRMREDKMLDSFGQILKIPDVRFLMIEMCISNIFNVIDINRDLVNQSKSNMNLEKKFKAFEWPRKQYLQRVTASDKYMNMLRFEHPDSLSIFKFLSDLKNLESLLHQILNSKNRALDSLRDCELKLTLQEDLSQELKNNRKVVANKMKELERFDYHRDHKQEIKEKFNNFVDGAMDDVCVIDPAKWRYRKHVIDGQTEEFKHRLEKNSIALKKDIDDYTTRIAKAQITHEHTMQICRIQTETLRTKVDFWSKEYNGKYEECNNTNSELNMRINVLNITNETLRKRMQYFRRELARLGYVQAKTTTQKENKTKEKVVIFQPLKSKLNRKKNQNALGRKMGKSVAAF